MSLFSSTVRDGVTGKVKHEALFRKNERTNAGINLQASQMAGTDGQTGTAMSSITATGATLTGLTGRSSNDLAGRWLATYGASGTLAVVGRIVSNSASSGGNTAVVIDSWQKGDGTAGTTPVTGTWHVLEGGIPANYLALSVTAFSSDPTATVLTAEYTSNGLSRAKGTFAHTLNATSYTLNKLFTASGGGGTVNEEAVFGAPDTTSGGPMTFRSAEPTPPALLAGDTLNQTVTVSF